MGKNLETHVEDILKEPSAILFDFTRVTNLEPSGLFLFQKILEKINSTGSDRIALSSISEESFSKIQELLNFEVPFFDSKSSAKVHLEKLNATKTHERVGATTQYTPVVEFTQKGDIYYVHCPGCSVKLRIRSIGNHACPSCKKRFYFNPDVPTKETEVPKEVEATHYEMLALD
ncbi:MAG: hypothetical protein KDK36_17835 [Leptospiraceae bacterium]|nr:hypothetical protein [Leptospiraceae bacterium]